MQAEAGDLAAATCPNSAVTVSDADSNEQESESGSEGIRSAAQQRCRDFEICTFSYGYGCRQET